MATTTDWTFYSARLPLDELRWWLSVRFDSLPDASASWLQIGPFEIGFEVAPANIVSPLVIARPLTCRSAWEALRCWTKLLCTRRGPDLDQLGCGLPRIDT